MLNSFQSSFGPRGPLLEVRHLRTLAAITEAGGVSAAAEALGVTPSAVTHRVREAERRLGVALFIRHGQQLRPTPAGELLNRTAGRVLGELERAEADVRELYRGVEHVVRIGIAFYSTYHWLPRFLSRWQKTSPAIHLEVVADAARRPLDTLVHGGVDLVVYPTDPTGHGIDGVRLFSDEQVAIMATDHRLAGRGHIEIEDLAEEVYLTYTLYAVPGHEYERLMRPKGVYPRRFMNVELPEVIVELVSDGFGVSILAAWAVAPHVRRGTLATARLTREGLAIDWYAAVRAADPADAPARKLAAGLAAWCREAPDRFATE